MQINTKKNYGLIKHPFNFTVGDGYTVLVGKNDAGKTSLLQLIFKHIIEDGGVGPSKICLLLPERIFVDATTELSGRSLEQYNNEIYGLLKAAPLPYHSLNHASSQLFKLLIHNKELFEQKDRVNRMLKKLGFSDLGLKRLRPIVDEIDVGRHGTGLRTSLSVIAAISDPTIEYILIDEPEQSLEPTIQKHFREMLYEATQTKKIIVATHSHLFLNRKNLQSNFIVEKRDDAVNLTQVQSEVELYDLVFKLLGSSPEDLFFPKNFIVVEGVSDQVVVEKIISLMEYSDSDVKVVSARSVSKLEKMRLTLEDYLTPYVMRDSHYKNKVVVLVDKPNDQTSNTVKEIKGEIGDRLFKLPNYSLEEYIPEEIYLRAGRNKKVDLQGVNNLKDNREELAKLKKTISNQLKTKIKKSDLVNFTVVKDAIEKAARGGKGEVGI